MLYHPEAVTLGMQPVGALDSLFDAVRDAARSAVGRPGDARKTRWPPHVTVAYSTDAQAAGPIITALGRELPDCEVTVSSISLIAQQGAERQWDWRSVAEIQLGPERLPGT